MYVRSVRILLLAFLFVGVRSASAQSYGPITLQFRVTQGDRYSFSTTISQKISGNIGGQSMTIDQKILGDLSLGVSTVRPNGNFVLTATYDRMGMSQDLNAGGEQMSTVVDTKDTTKNKGMLAPSVMEKFNKLIGLHFDLEFTKAGTPVHSNLDSVLELSGAADLGGGSENNQFTVTFPDHPVKVGDTWHSTSIKNKKGQQINTETDYTLNAIHDKAVEVGVASKVSGTMPNGTISGTVNGTYTLDADTGMLVSGSLTSDMDVKMKDPTSGNESPVKVASDISVTSAKAK